MTADELRGVVDKNAKWRRGEDGGERADLYRADLRGADLREADLREADLCGVNLREANLREADLREANNIPSTTAAQLLTCPESGAFEAWKKCREGVLVRVRIPADARRLSATTRKCRSEYVDVLEVIGAEVGISQHDNRTEYRAGQRVTCHEWCEDRWQECAGGIHFFITRAEAEEY